MEDTRFTPQPAKGWFWIGATAVLLFMAAGVIGYLDTIVTAPDRLPVERRMLMEAMPGWHRPVYAVAIWSGLMGAVGLVMRRRTSVPVLLISLLAAIGTFLPFVVVPEVRELATRGDFIAAIIVIGLCAASLWFAHRSKQKGWLR